MGMTDTTHIHASGNISVPVEGAPEVLGRPYNIVGVERTPNGEALGDYTVTMENPAAGIRNRTTQLTLAKAETTPVDLQIVEDWVSGTSTTVRVLITDDSGEPADCSFGITVLRNSVG